MCNVAFEASDLAFSRRRSAPEKGSSNTSVLSPTIATVFDKKSEGMQYAPSADVSFNPVYLTEGGRVGGARQAMVYPGGRDCKGPRLTL